MSAFDIPGDRTSGTKRSIARDDELLALARRELTTTGVSDTVRAAVRQAADAAARAGQVACRPPSGLAPEDRVALPPTGRACVGPGTEGTRTVTCACRHGGHGPDHPRIGVPRTLPPVASGRGTRRRVTGLDLTRGLAGEDAGGYEREHLVWVRHLGDGVNLWVCSDGLAVWDDESPEGTRLLSRVWLTDGAPLRPLLAFSASRGW